MRNNENYLILRVGSGFKVGPGVGSGPKIWARPDPTATLRLMYLENKLLTLTLILY